MTKDQNNTPLPHEKTVSRFIEIFVRIINKYNALNKTAYDFGSGETLYPSEIHLLASLESENDPFITELATQLGVTKSAASQMVKKLDKKGYLEKYLEPDNQKNILLHLTEKGKAAVAGYQEFKHDLFADLVADLADLTDEQIALIQRVLERIDRHMDYKLKKFKEMTGK